MFRLTCLERCSFLGGLDRPGPGPHRGQQWHYPHCSGPWLHQAYACTCFAWQCRLPQSDHLRSDFPMAGLLKSLNQRWEQRPARARASRQELPTMRWLQFSFLVPNGEMFKSNCVGAKKLRGFIGKPLSLELRPECVRPALRPAVLHRSLLIERRQVCGTLQ